MILPLLALSFAISICLAQSTSSCPTIGNADVTPGALTAFPDQDPHFVYSRDNCTSTSQKTISKSWTRSCSTAIDSLCGNTNPNSAPVGHWTWAWFSDAGSACQVGLWQPEPSQPSSPVGISEDCCRKSFSALVMRVDGLLQAGGNVEDAPNRGSANIAKGGYPFAKATYDSGQALTDGVQVAQGYPSFILQG